jgi:polyphenol oxidase
VPVFLFDPRHNAVAAIHAGWRGTVAHIAGLAVQMMNAEFGTTAADLLAYIGPSASVCCYAVGDDVSTKFDDRFVECRDGRMYVDLKSANRQHLTDAGIPVTRIEVSPHCTISEPDLFHSFRRDGQKSGRMMGVIGLTR